MGGDEQLRPPPTRSPSSGCKTYMEQHSQTMVTIKIRKEGSQMGGNIMMEDIRDHPPRGAVHETT